LSFLRHNEFETIYIVGDLIDFWQLRHKHFWPQSHNDVLQKILRKSRKGTKVIYIPGNHDEFMTEFVGHYGNVSIVGKAIHKTANHKTYIVVHGHEFDLITQNMRWISVLGDAGYQLLLLVNHPLHWFKKMTGGKPWSLSAYVKKKAKVVANFIGRFEKAVVHFAELHKTDGIICGHIHTPSSRQIDGFEYWNTGDWVESCSALVEHLDGRLELLTELHHHHLQV
jgi:UDP-2,3-diacylglucosamine pyrophosphatase LpxH